MAESSHNQFVILGSYTEKEAGILRMELEKNNIPAQAFYPEKSEARAEWLAQTFMVPSSKVGQAIKICRALNMTYDAKLVTAGSRIFNWIIFLLVLGAIFAVGYFLYLLKY